MKRYVVALLVGLGVVGLVGVLAIEAGYAKDEAKDEDDARAKCSEAALHGRYLFAVAGYQVSNGNGKLNGVVSVNFDGQIARKETFSGTYTVKADCTSTITLTDGTQFDQFIAPDGSMLTFVQTHPSELVAAGSALQGTAKRVGD